MQPRVVIPAKPPKVLDLLLRHHRRATINQSEVKAICKRIFTYRKMQSWPPVVTKNEGWDELYASARHELPVLETATEAVARANELIRKIDESEEA